MPTLPVVDDEPDHWGPDHHDLDLSPVEVSAGNLLGMVIDVDEDLDRGQQSSVHLEPPR